MTQKISRDDIALYVMGAYDGDVAALEARIADDAAARAMLAEEASLELSLRDAAAAGTFCPNCDDLVADTTEPLRCISCGAAVQPGGYAIERVIVANAHGRMYVARDADGTRVALKELAFVQSPSTETIAAFEREARFLRALEHPAIPRFLAAFEEGTGVHTRYYLAQELVDGTALDTRLADHFYSEAEIVEIARQVLGVLVYLQGLSPMVIHRDIKPANLLRRSDGTIAVVDFGAAHVQGTTAGSTSIGTFGYMPLEQLAGQVDATTDTYALGASLVHLLTRREPWRVFGPATFESINVSPALQQFLAKCVAPEPKDRFANAAAALAGLDAPAVAAKHAPRLPRGVWKIGIGVLAAALTLGGAGVAGYFLRGEPAQPAADARKQTHSRAELNGIILSLRARLDELREKTDAASVGMRRAIEIKLAEMLFLYNSAGDDDAQKLREKAEKLRALADELRDKAQESAIEQQMLLPYDVHKKPEPAPAPRPVAAFTSMVPIDLDFKAAPLAMVVRTIGTACGVNVVMPSYLKADVTVKVKKTPCSEIFEAILEAHGLGYAYEPSANLVRIAPRKELDSQREIDAMRFPIRAMIGPAEPLPSGPTIELDYKQAELRSVLELLADVNKVNLVMPDYLRGQITILAKSLPWSAAVESVLASQGLWYRYRPEGRILRIAPRKELDAEDEMKADKQR